MAFQLLTFTKRAWAKNGSFLSVLPLRPLLFLTTKVTIINQGLYWHADDHCERLRWITILTEQCSSGSDCEPTPRCPQSPWSAAPTWWRAGVVGILSGTVRTHAHQDKNKAIPNLQNSVSSIESIWTYTVASQKWNWSICGLWSVWPSWAPRGRTGRCCRCPSPTGGRCTAWCPPGPQRPGRSCPSRWRWSGSPRWGVFKPTAEGKEGGLCSVPMGKQKLTTDQLIEEMFANIQLSKIGSRSTGSNKASRHRK